MCNYAERKKNYKIFVTNQKMGKENIYSCRPTSDKGSNSSFSLTKLEGENKKKKKKTKEKTSAYFLDNFNHIQNHVNEVREAQKDNTTSNMLILDS